MAKKQSPSTLLWFIRRKSYVPLCEIRRRFELDGEEGAFIDGDQGTRLFVGLPANTASAIEKLWRQNKIGLELSVEFDCRVLIGVYPMSPVRDVEALHAHGSSAPPLAKIIDMPDPVAPPELGATPPPTAIAAAD
jgi:hypothetical protein